MEIKPQPQAVLPFLRIVIWVALLYVLAGTVLPISKMIQEQFLGIKMPNPSYFQQSLSSAAGAATDSIPLPPTREELFSPSKNYVFVLSTPDNWKSKKAVGELFQVTTNTRKRLWTRLLPHEYRPRYVLVGSEGQVLLLDEWINVKSRYAVMLLSRENHLVAQHDFDAVRNLLDVPVAKVVRMAKYGWWIASPPTLDTSGEIVRVEAAGKVLIIHLCNGYLSLG